MLPNCAKSTSVAPEYFAGRIIALTKLPDNLGPSSRAVLVEAGRERSTSAASKESVLSHQNDQAVNLSIPAAGAAGTVPEAAGRSNRVVVAGTTYLRW